MFRKSRKDTLVDQAQSLAHDLTEAIVPRVEKAREDLRPVLSDVRDAGAARLADARDAVAPKLADVRDAGAARLADARDAVAPKLADARDTAAPIVGSARDRTILGVQQVVSDVREQAQQAAAEAERRREVATAALRGEEVEKGSKGTRLLFVLALAGIGAVVGKKLAGGDQSDNWQSSYTPAPAPAAPAAPATHPITTPADPAESVDVTDTPDPKV